MKYRMIEVPISEAMPKPRKLYTVKAFGAHIGINDPEGCSVLNVIDRGSVERTLMFAAKVVDALNRDDN